MIQWYVSKVKFTKEFTDGTLKRVTEEYLFNAVSFSDVEERVYKEVGEFVRGEFLVKDISAKQINDIFCYEDCETWWECKIEYITENADSGKEKKITNVFLVSAHSLREANDRIIASLKGIMVTFEVLSIAKSKIVEIFPYEPPSEEDDSEDIDNDSKSVESPNINVGYSMDEEE